MAISFGSAGAAAVGTTSLSVAYPASIAAGDLLVLCIANKYPPNKPTEPSGWTTPANSRQSGGGGAPGADSGDVYCAVFVKTATGSESGSLTVTITSGNAAVGRMFRYACGAGSTWDVACDNGSETSPDTDWTVMGPYGFSAASGDWIVVASAINTDAYTFSAHSFSGSLTYGSMTERQDSGTTNGDDCALEVADCAISSGSSSAEYGTYNATASGSDGGSNPCGASVFVRIRELAAATTFDPFGMTGFFGV